MSDAQIKAVAATGDITTGDSYLHCVILTGGSDAATAVVKAGGSGGVTVLTLKAATATSVSTGALGPAYCENGIHVTLTGTAPAFTATFE